MKKLIPFYAVILLTISSFGQSDPKTVIGKLGPNPIFLIDSQRVTKSGLSNYNSNSIAIVIVLYDTTARKLYGDSAKDGAVIIETRSFARNKFISFFRKSSKSFDSLYTAVGTDTAFKYVLNDKIQNGNFEGNLSSINNELLIGIEILNKEQLQRNYNVTDKQFGILVRSKRLKDLYNADKKF